MVQPGARNDGEKNIKCLSKKKILILLKIIRRISTMYELLGKIH